MQSLIVCVDGYYLMVSSVEDKKLNFMKQIMKYMKICWYLECWGYDHNLQ